jgi:hypothetical protein
VGRWAWEARDLEGNPRSELRPRAASIARVLNGPTTLELELDAALAGEVASTARVVFGWRRPVSGGTRTLRAAAKVAQIAAESAADSPERVRVFAMDAVGVFGARIGQTTTTHGGEIPSAILFQRIALQNLRAPTGLVADPVGTGGPPRDRTYEPGKPEGEILQQLAELDDGFYYRVDPVDDGGEEFSELVLLYPDPGASSSARLGWGAGTEGNVSEVSAEVRTPTNSVIGFGAGDGDEQLRVVRSDAASIAALGLYDGAVTHADVIMEDTLAGHALDALRVTEPRLFRVTVAAPVASATAYVPEPWEDFDVGDTLELDLRGESAPLQYTGPALVQAFTVSIDAEGTERLYSLDLAEL